MSGLSEDQTGTVCSSPLALLELIKEDFIDYFLDLHLQELKTQE